MVYLPEQKVLVGVTAYPGDYHCRPQFVSALRAIPHDKFISWNGEKPWGYEGMNLVPVDQEFPTLMENLAYKQNILRQAAIDGGYSHLLMLESDNIPPFDIVEQLIQWDKPIVAGLYFLRFNDAFALPASQIPKTVLTVAKAMNKGKKKIGYGALMWERAIPCVWGLFKTSISGRNHPKMLIRLWELEDWIEAKNRGTGIVPIYGAGMGCTLLARETFGVEFQADYEWPDGKEREQTTDFIWFTKARLEGFFAYLAVDTVVNHLHAEFADYGHLQKWNGMDGHNLKEGYFDPVDYRQLPLS